LSNRDNVFELAGRWRSAGYWSDYFYYFQYKFVPLEFFNF